MKPLALRPITLLAASAPTQCNNFWESLAPAPGVFGDPHCTIEWHPDGSRDVVAGGGFTLAGGSWASYVATWNGTRT